MGLSAGAASLSLWWLRIVWTGSARRRSPDWWAVPGRRFPTWSTARRKKPLVTAAFPGFRPSLVCRRLVTRRREDATMRKRPSGTLLPLVGWGKEPGVLPRFKKTGQTVTPEPRAPQAGQWDRQPGRALAEAPGDCARAAKGQLRWIRDRDARPLGGGYATAMGWMRDRALLLYSRQPPSQRAPVEHESLMIARTLPVREAGSGIADWGLGPVGRPASVPNSRTLRRALPSRRHTV